MLTLMKPYETNLDRYSHGLLPQFPLAKAHKTRSSSVGSRWPPHAFAPDAPVGGVEKEQRTRSIPSGNLTWLLLKMGILDSYVSLPKGICRLWGVKELESSVSYNGFMEL